MAILQGFEVTIESDGVALQEYDDPEKGANGGEERITKFVEAAAGRTFSICVKATPGFRFYEGNSVDVDPILDGLEVTSLNLSREYLTTTEGWRWNDERAYNAEKGLWMSTEFSFGHLEILEDDELGSAASPSEKTKVGIVTIEVCRAKRRRLRTRVLVDGEDYPFLGDVRQISEKDVKGRDLETSIAFVNKRIIRPPSPERYKYTVLNGWKGREITFNFKYRSRTFLQTIGCIPLDPSPPPASQNTLEPNTTDVKVNDEVQEAKLPISVFPNNEPKGRNPKIKENDAQIAAFSLGDQYEDPKDQKGIQGVLAGTREISEQRQTILTEIARLEEARLQRLLGELARLDNQVKQQAMTGGLEQQNARAEQSITKEEDLNTQIKRERESVVHIKTEGEGSRKRAKTSGPAVIIDLTDD